MKTTRRLLALLALAALLCALTGCGSDKLPDGAAENDILTFTPNAEDRPIIRIGTQYYTPDSSLCDTLQARFPEYLFVMDYSAAAGKNSEGATVKWLRGGSVCYDMVIGGALGSALNGQETVFVDLSAEPFLDNYLLSALNSVSVDGHIYSIPGTSTLSGIAYNADMFAEHGWQVPETQDEFFALCAEIKAAGIAPMSACFKYDGAVNRLLTMMNYTNVFASAQGAASILAVQTGGAGLAGWYEPVYETAKRFVDEGVLGIDIFTASLTQQRNDFWAGQYAMIDYDSAIYTYAEAEGCPFELGIMPYPSLAAGDAGFAVAPEYYLYIPLAVEKDPERLAVMKEILAFLSTEEGQNAMLKGSLRVSNVKGVGLQDSPAAPYAAEAVEKGNLYPIVTYPLNRSLPVIAAQKDAVQSIFEGAGVADAIAYTDSQLEAARSEPSSEPSREVVAQASESFTILETSYYIADKLREATGADVALVADRGFFRSNLAFIAQGDVDSNMERFVMKGVGAEDWLTSYTLTGAQLRELLQHPYINGEEIDEFIAASGLAVEYAPWNPRGERLLSVTLEDGSALSDDAEYTVAAWAGVIDERYITETLESFDELGSIEDIMLAALTRDGTVAPDIGGRVTLVWAD